MFEEEAKELIEIALHRIAEGRSVIAVQDILAADVPSPLKTFFRADAEILLNAEERNHRSTSRFDHSHPEVESLQRQINSILVLRYAYHETEFYDHLNDGVRLIIGYLGHPQRTLVDSVFEKKDEATVEDVSSFLLRMEPYDYLRNLLLRFFSLNNISRINRKQFSVLLRKLDGAYISRKDGNQIARILGPYFTMINFLRVRGEPTLPVRALKDYFDDKGLLRASSAFEGTTVQGKESLTTGELAVFLEDRRRTDGPFGVEATTTTPPVTPPKPIRNEVPSPPPPPPPPSPTPGTAPKLEFSEQDRKRFTKKIFRDDEGAYTKAIEKLRSLPRWKDASRTIDEIFISQGIDPYSSDAKHFLQVLYQQYHPK